MKIIGGANIVKRGLVLYLDSANKKSYTTDSSMVWNNLIGQDQVTFQGSVTTDGKSLDFLYGNGRVPKTSIYDFQISSFTIGAIFMVHDAAGYTWFTQILCCWNTGASPGTNEWSFGVGTPAGLPLGKPWLGVETSVGPTAFNCWAQNDVSAAKYIYATGVRDGSTLIMYINGILDNSINDVKITNLKPSINDLYVAGLRNGTSPGPYATFRFNGHIGLIHLYNRALTPTEIYQNYIALGYRYDLK